MEQDFCESLEIEDGVPGEHCTRESCTIQKCSSCSVDGTACYACESGYIGPSCEAEESFFADVQTSVMASGIVAMSSPRLHGLLAAGFSGTGNRGQATELVAQAFTRKFKDEFEIVLVYPAASLSENVAHQEYFGGKTLGGTTRLQGIVCGGNPSAGGWKAVLHEIAHNYIRPQTVLPANHYYSHWGLVSLGGDVPGMLGGYTKAAVTCGSTSCSFDTSAGSLQASY